MQGEKGGPAIRAAYGRPQNNGDQDSLDTDRANQLLVTRNPTNAPMIIPDQGLEVSLQAVPPAPRLKYPTSKPTSAPAAMPIICLVLMLPTYSLCCVM